MTTLVPSLGVETHTDAAETQKKRKASAIVSSKLAKRARMDEDLTAPSDTGLNDYQHADDAGTEEVISPNLGANSAVSGFMDIKEDEDDREDEELLVELRQKAEKAKILVNHAKTNLSRQEQALKECASDLANIDKQKRHLQKKKTALCSLKRSEVRFCDTSICHCLTIIHA